MTDEQMQTERREFAIWVLGGKSPVPRFDAWLARASRDRGVELAQVFRSKQLEDETMTEQNKAQYVKAQIQTRKHQCHWPGCTTQVPPAMWGCSKHWFALPSLLRNKVWATFKPGQEVTGTPSPAYIKAAKELQAWINSNALP